MNRAIIDASGTVMQFVGDAVMAVFGAPVPVPDHAERAVEAALEMHAAQARVNKQWVDTGLAPFELGIGVTTGPAAAALLGSEERLEYTLVGDTVNLSQRLQQWADPGETVLSETTYQELSDPPAGHGHPSRPREGPRGTGLGVEDRGGHRRQDVQVTQVHRQPETGSNRCRSWRHEAFARPTRPTGRPSGPCGASTSPWTTPSSWPSWARRVAGSPRC